MPALKLLAFTFLLLVSSLTFGFGQSVEEFPLRGKRVAVYFSKKHFSFDDNYRIPLSQFIKSDQGENAEIEDIKLQTLVALGTLFAQQLKKPAEADSTYFLNEFPEMASKFIGSYGSDDHTLEPLGELFVEPIISWSSIRSFSDPTKLRRCILGATASSPSKS